MKFLKCKICSGELDIIANIYAKNKIVKCRECGFSNINQKDLNIEDNNNSDSNQIEIIYKK